MSERILKILLLDLIPSFGDLCSDLFNSLDMLGFNASHTLAGNNTIINTILANSNSGQDIIWGSLGLTLIFAPGVPTSIFWLVNFGLKDVIGWCTAILCFAFYPAIMLLLQVAALFTSTVDEKWIVVVVAGEAFFESSPQLALQLFTIQYGYTTTPLQIFTILLSFILVAKTAIRFDLRVMGKRFANRKEAVKHILIIIPAYSTGIIFRIGGLSIIAAYLRYWSFIPIILRSFQYAALASILGYRWKDIPITVISNLGCMTRGTVPDRSFGSETDNKVLFKFLVISSLTTFVQITTCLVTILAMTSANPKYFPHWTTRLVFFQDTVPVVMGVIGVGLANLVLLYVTRKYLNT